MAGRLDEVFDNWEDIPTEEDPIDEELSDVFNPLFRQDTPFCFTEPKTWKANSRDVLG